MTGAAIEFGQLLELVWAAAVAGVLVSVLFALVIVGATRATDRRREHRGGAAARYGALALLALAGFAGTVAFAISVIVTK